MITVRDTYSQLVVKHFEERKIEYAFHDIDGTHSLIREWPPVMSICLYDVIENGLPEDFDKEENIKRLIDFAGSKPLPETDDFCIRSAGLSALTQMEWAIRRAVCEGRVKVDCDKRVNALIIEKIRNGEEHYDCLAETEEMKALLAEKTPRLFRLYESVLNGYCRDKNLTRARENPAEYQVKGSLDFLAFLKENGVKNYFVTGAVVEKGMGMYEEVEALGYKVGKGQLIEELIGSTWTEKKPKDTVMSELVKKLGINSENILVVGDGRAEIQAGTDMNALVVSRLPENAHFHRQLHKTIGTNIITKDFENPLFKELFR